MHQDPLHSPCPPEDASDPLLAALRQQLGDYGQAPPPGAWAGIEQRLPQPAAPRPWWGRLQRLLLLLALVALVAVGTLMLRPSRAGAGRDAPTPGPASAYRATGQPTGRPVAPGYLDHARQRVTSPAGAAALATVAPPPVAPPPVAPRPGTLAKTPLTFTSPGSAAGTRVGAGKRPAALLTHPLALAGPLHRAPRPRRPVERPARAWAGAALNAGAASSPFSLLAAGPEHHRARRQPYPGGPLPATGSPAPRRTPAAGPHAAAGTGSARASLGFTAKARRRTRVAGVASAAFAPAPGTQPATGQALAQSAASAGVATRRGVAAGSRRGARQTALAPPARERSALAGAADPAAPVAGAQPAAALARGRQRVFSATAGVAPALIGGERLDFLLAALPTLVVPPAAPLPTPVPRPDSLRLHSGPARRWGLLVVAGPTLSYRTLGPEPVRAGTPTSGRAGGAGLERPAAGWGAQGQVRRVLSGHWALAAGLGYQEYATRLALQVRAPGDSAYKPVHQRDTYQLLTLPVQLSYALGAPRGRLATALLLGAEPGWYRGGRSSEGSGCSCQQQTFTGTPASPYHAWSLGLSLGLDLRYRLGGPAARWQWVVQPTGRYMLTPFVRADALDYAPRHPFSLGFFTGFAWDLR